jgi:hypothetical protein
LDEFIFIAAVFANIIDSVFNTFTSWPATAVINHPCAHRELAVRAGLALSQIVSGTVESSRAMHATIALSRRVKAYLAYFAHTLKGLGLEHQIVDSWYDVFKYAIK